MLVASRRPQCRTPNGLCVGKSLLEGSHGGAYTRLRPVNIVADKFSRHHQLITPMPLGECLGGGGRRAARLPCPFANVAHSRRVATTPAAT